jgi:hypothetical protein
MEFNEGWSVEFSNWRGLGESGQKQSTHQPVAALEVVPMSKSTLPSEASQLLPDFHTDLVRQLEALVGALSEGVAHLSIGRMPGHPEFPEPYCEIIPRNPRAAPIRCIPAADDLHLTVGNSWREFYGFARGGTVVPGATWQEELGTIWLAVVAGRLTERLNLDSQGEVIGWNSKLVLNGGEIIFRNGSRAERFFGRAKVKTVIYEPYT